MRTTRKLQPSALLEPLWALFSTSTALQLHIVQLMRLRRGCWWKIINDSPMNTSCRAYRCQPETLCLSSILPPHKPIFSPFRQRHQCHIYSSDLMKFIPPVGAVLLFSFARSRSAYPNRATASFHTVRNFLTEHSHNLSWHADDLDISGNQSVQISLGISSWGPIRNMMFLLPGNLSEWLSYSSRGLVCLPNNISFLAPSVKCCSDLKRPGAVCQSAHREIGQTHLLLL